MKVRPLSSELQTIAENELGEDPSRLEEDVQHIKDWLAKQPHLNSKTDDQWILTFLRGCKFSLEQTKHKLDLYYTMRTLAPEYFSNRDPFLPEIQECLKRGAVLPLPQTDGPGGPVVVIFRYTVLDPDKIAFETVVKTGMMIFDILMNENDNMIPGQHIVFDAKDMPYGYLTQMTPAVLKKLVILYQNAYPTRSKSFQHINAPSFYYAIVNLFRQFVSEKLRRRIFVYGNDGYDGLYNTIPRNVLPKEYGGSAPSVDEIAAEWKLKVENYRNWLLEDEKHRSDEAKRPGKPITASDMVGVEGSFRKLAVD